MKEYYTGDPKLHKELEQKVGKRMKQTLDKKGITIVEPVVGTKTNETPTGVWFKHSPVHTIVTGYTWRIADEMESLPVELFEGNLNVSRRRVLGRKSKKPNTKNT